MMYNEIKPDAGELPTTIQLLKSTVIAGVSAAVILITIVLPAEFGIDPTGFGNVVGLTEMGRTKTQLSNEAEAGRLQELVGDADGWTDKYSATLAPNGWIELKLTMKEGAEVEYLWITEGGVLSFDMHGDGAGGEVSYRKGRARPGDEGILKAGIAGNHGWFWSNGDEQDVTVSLYIRGDYTEILLP